MEKFNEVKNKVMNMICYTKIPGAVGALFAIIGVFLPLVKVNVFGMKGTISFIEGDGKFILILNILALSIIFSDLIASKWEKGRNVFEKLNNPKLVLIPTIISAIIMINLNSNYKEYSIYAKYQIGFFAIWFGIILTATYGIFYKSNVKQNENNVKEEQ